MRIGTAIFFGLVLIFFAGILLQSNLQSGDEIRALQEALSTQQAANQTLRAQNQELSDTLHAQEEALAKAQEQIEAFINQEP